MAKKASRSLQLQEIANRLQSEGNLGDLTVPEGETRVLTYQSQDMKRYFMQIRVTSIDEVKDLIGVPDRVAVRMPAIGSTNILSAEAQTTVGAGDDRVKRIPARTINPKMLSGPADDDETLEAFEVARTAAEQYVYANSQDAQMHKALVNSYLEHRLASIFAAIVGNITVHDNATLHIANSTFVVYANRVRLYGSGKIQCNGPTTFDVQSMWGNIKPGGFTGPEDIVFEPFEPAQN